MGIRNPRRARWWAEPLLWVELFALSNVAFLAVDIFIAHASNGFAHWAEWVPFGFSLTATVLLASAMLLGGPTPHPPQGEGRDAEGPRPRVARWLGLAVGYGAVLVGVAGLLFHLDSQFFGQQTLKNLVYAAPFAAPLAYAGVGLLLILDRMVDARSVEWARWVVLLALGGFIGNFVLSLTDHAQNGFFVRAEWIPVASSAMAVGILVAVLLVYDNRPLLRLCAWVMGAQVVVGVLGALLHGRTNLARPRQSLWEGFLYGAPVFAPLLFADLAILAVLALLALERAMPAAEPVEARQPSP